MAASHAEVGVNTVGRQGEIDLLDDFLYFDAPFRQLSYATHIPGGTMAVKTETLPEGIGLIEVKGSLIGGEETDDMRRAIAGFVDKEYAKLIIDLSKVNYLNSTAIGVLVSAQTTYSRKKWQVKLCGINKNISSIFVVTKLTLVFDVHDSREDAIKNFK